MDIKKVIKELRKAGKIHDTEVAHSNADKIICEFLITLGYEKVVDAYRNVEKWYA